MRAFRPLIALLVLTLLAAVPARAELSQQGDVVVAFNGALSPKVLPRVALRPVAVRVAGDIRDANGVQERLPQLRTISVAINSAGQLYDKGLPVCRVASIQPATEAEAHRVCGDAIVGSGRVTVQARIPSQVPFEVNAKLLAFNGPRKNGHKLILAQVYSKNPPGAFVLPFTVRKRPGVFGTVMSTALPSSAREWAFLTHFEMTLKRSFRSGGRARSYISAACSAPAGFTEAVFPFAKGSFGFDNGQRLTTTVMRSCRVKR